MGSTVKGFGLQESSVGICTLKKSLNQWWKKVFDSQWCMMSLTVKEPMVHTHLLSHDLRIGQQIKEPRRLFLLCFYPHVHILYIYIPLLALLIGRLFLPSLSVDCDHPEGSHFLSPFLPPNLSFFVSHVLLRFRPSRSDFPSVTRV